LLPILDQRRDTGAAQVDPFFIVVATGLLGGHPITCVTVECIVVEQDLDPDIGD
jgi:hypothetical protein